MGSLNGDLMVIRNGRSTSQISVYNYPEHLNPFYEDDQHKRLRFWKISKKNNEGRRNSFSIGNLKDMWAFKSFRSNKKSSTLGINKTSESPPMLRRDYTLENGCNTFDQRLRGNNTFSLNGDSFQRNATYRSSLQTLPTNSDRIGLNRNDGYRSTIQVTRSNPRYQPQQKQQSLHQQTMGVSHNRRYVYGGSVTPQPMRNTRNTSIFKEPYESDCDNSIIRRSSQSSMVSTNPFESDDDENEDINMSGMKSVTSGSTTTLTSRTPRKKRRAPAPPTPVHGRNSGALTPPIIRIIPSHESTQDELHIEEDIENIANLTAEIESFVKTKSNDDAEVMQKSERSSTTTLLDNKEKAKIEVEVERKLPESNSIHTVTTITENIYTSPNQKLNVTAKANGQVTNQATTAAVVAETNREKQINVSQVSPELKMKLEESKEIKINGALPKKQTNMIVEQQLQEQTTTAAAKEYRTTEELQQNPVPLKRQTKPEAEVGHVECIHVHVESPKATPRKDYQNGLSTFKSSDTIEDEIITTKTPFVLTSPPTPRRKPLQGQTVNTETVTKETVKMVETTTVNKKISELNIKEERNKVKPEILAKPALSPKPVTKDVNGNLHGFAEIHKPLRKINQNGHISRGNISPTPIIVPQAEPPKEDEKKINNTVDAQREKLQQFATSDSLKIIENTTKEIKKENISKETAQHNDLPKRDIDEFDLLYRPKPTSHLEWKRSTLAPLETNIPPEKRKSVKDIIESINRSQRLLNAAANKDFTVLQNQNVTLKTQTNNNLNENPKSFYESHVAEATATTTTTTGTSPAVEAAKPPSPSPSNYNNESAAESPQLDNNEIFKKCRVKKEVYDYRESSPISSNLDWNPLPKPKRTKPGQD